MFYVYQSVYLFLKKQLELSGVVKVKFFFQRTLLQRTCGIPVKKKSFIISKKTISFLKPIIIKRNKIESNMARKNIINLLNFFLFVNFQCKQKRTRCPLLLFYLQIMPSVMDLPFMYIFKLQDVQCSNLMNLSCVSNPPKSCFI